MTILVYSLAAIGLLAHLGLLLYGIITKNSSIKYMYTTLGIAIATAAFIYIVAIGLLHQGT